MNSIKNLFVIVMLMGVSYGAFQVINAPDPNLSENVPDIEALDIQIGPRTDDPGGFSTPPLADNNQSPSMTAPPTLPPLPSNLSRTAATQPPIQPPPMGDSRSQLPNIDLTGLQNMADPRALATTETGPGFKTPPPLAPINPANSRPIPGSQFVAQSGRSGQPGNSQFNPSPQTNLEPVTPRPSSTFAPSTGSGNRFVGAETPATGNAAIENPTLQPAREATDMLQSVGNHLASRAEGLISATSPEGNAPGLTTAQPVATANIDWQGISDLANAGQAREALKTLSSHFESGLPQDQRLQMLEWLDMLAGKVIYSTEHQLQTAPYVVRQDDTLERLSSQWSVPAQLIYNINAEKISDPAMLVPGTELKMVQGPFNAVVSLQRQELVLFLDGLYAGRFPIELGQDGNGITHGKFLVREKREGKEYQDSTGQTFVAGAANNPYGQYWIGLAEGMGIHEFTPQPGQQDNRGSIRLARRDAADVYGILSNGSQVTIMR